MNTYVVAAPTPDPRFAVSQDRHVEAGDRVTLSGPCNDCIRAPVATRLGCRNGPSIRALNGLFTAGGRRLDGNCYWSNVMANWGSWFA